MRHLDILIPTLKPRRELADQIDAIERTTHSPHRIIASCQPLSAARNRNLCLEWGRSDPLIMLDDDISGFTEGWEERLVAPIFADAKICVASARLMHPDGRVGDMCNVRRTAGQGWFEVPVQRDCVMPSAAIAFRNWGLRFDEQFVGSGYEDGDFCFQYRAIDKQAKFVVTDDCRLVHANEAKNQYIRECWSGPGGCTLYSEPKGQCLGCNFRRNRDYFWKKWGVGQ
jgi:hypothetical protein